MRRLLPRSDQFASLDRRVLRRTAVVIGAGAALCGVAAVLAVKEGRELHDSAPVVQSNPADPLLAEMRRCQLLGEPGAHDPGCLAAWAENRRRFLDVDRRPIAPNPQSVLPSSSRPQAGSLGDE